MKFLSHLNKDLILNLIYLISFLFIVYKILSATLFQQFKKKLNPWDQSDSEKDFDKILKKRIDMFRASNGAYVSENQSLNTMSKHVVQSSSKNNTIPAQLKPIYDDLSWGNGEEIKKIIKIFQREFNYSPNEKSIRDAVKLLIKNDVFLKIAHQSSKEEINNLIYAYLLMRYYINEAINQNFNLLKKIGLRLYASEKLMHYSVQYLLLSNSDSKEKLSDQNVLKSYSEEDIQTLIDIFFIRNSNNLKLNINTLSEILREQFGIADFIRPWPNKNEINNKDIALEILRCTHKSDLEEIKRNYKKLAQEKHPDKIHALKLPKELEHKAMQQFQIVKQAYDFLNEKN